MPSSSSRLLTNSTCLDTTASAFSRAANACCILSSAFFATLFHILIVFQITSSILDGIWTNFACVFVLITRFQRTYARVKCMPLTRDKAVYPTLPFFHNNFLNFCKAVRILCMCLRLDLTIPTRLRTC